MFLKVHSRSKDGKEHRYYSLVESVRTSRGPQHRTLAYLGELNGSSEAAWRRSIAVFNGEGTECQLELFASDCPVVPSGERRWTPVDGREIPDCAAGGQIPQTLKSS